MIGWHHQLIEYEFEQTVRDSEGQKSLVCCSPWSCKVSGMYERLKNNGNFLYNYLKYLFSSVQSLSSIRLFVDTMNLSMPGLPVHHKLPEFTQTHAHRVSDAIQPSHPLSSPSPPAPDPSQHQGLFQ